MISKGLYRRYDGQYLFVYGVVNDVELNTYVRFSYITAPSIDYLVRLSEVMSNRFIMIDDDGDEVAIPIEEHPLNFTGQKEYLLRVMNLDNFEKNLSTQDLIDELRTREDSPLHDLDIEGFNSRVYSREYVLGIPVEEHEINGRTIPKCVDVQGVYDTKEEVRKGIVSAKLQKKDRLKIYKRVYLEEVKLT